MAYGLQYVNPVQTEPMLLLPGEGQAASFNDSRDWMAAVHRNMWEDYKARFMPFEDALMRSVGAHGELLDQTGRSVDQAFNVMRQEHAHRLGGYGVSMRPDEQQALDRRMGLQHAASKAGALNTTRAALQDRDLAIMGGGLGSLAGSRHG